MEIVHATIARPGPAAERREGLAQDRDNVAVAAPRGTAGNETPATAGSLPQEARLDFGTLMKKAVCPSVSNFPARGRRWLMVACRRDTCKFILDLPLPQVFHTRPWRCVRCNIFFKVQMSDIRRTFQGVLPAKAPKAARLFFTERFLQLILGKFAETFNAAAVKRFIIDLYLANTVYINQAESAMWATQSVPRLQSLRFMLREALLSYLPGLIKHIEEHVHTYSGSAVRGDGHYKIAGRIRAGCKGNAANVIYAWIGVDGALLRPPSALQSETWPQLRPDLEALLRDLVRHRMRAGLSAQTACPAFHATASFGKHRLKLRALYRSVAKPLLATVAVTPQGEATSVRGCVNESPTLRLV